MSLDFLNLEHTVGMIADQTHRVLVRNHAHRTDRDQAVIVAIASFDPLPERVPVEVVILDVVLLRKPARENVQIT